MAYLPIFGELYIGEHIESSPHTSNILYCFLPCGIGKLVASKPKKVLRNIDHMSKKRPPENQTAGSPENCP